jgi:hypothetical protein
MQAAKTSVVALSIIAPSIMMLSNIVQLKLSASCWIVINTIQLARTTTLISSKQGKEVQDFLLKSLSIFDTNFMDFSSKASETIIEEGGYQISQISTPPQFQNYGFSETLQFSKNLLNNLFSSFIGWFLHGLIFILLLLVNLIFKYLVPSFLRYSSSAMKSVSNSLAFNFYITFYLQTMLNLMISSFYEIINVFERRRNRMRSLASGTPMDFSFCLSFAYILLSIFGFTFLTVYIVM